jgi:hypothetical protein
MIMKKLIIFLILSLTLAIADQINVSNAGSDTNGDGSSGSPFKTIQYAIEHANTSSGDTILVAVGTYAENINFRGKDIVIGSLTLTTSDKSYVSQTIIDGGSPSDINSASVVTFIGGETSAAKLVGFTLQNGNGLLISDIRYGGGIYTKSSSPSLKHLIIKNNANSSNSDNLFGGGIFFGQKSDALLDSSAVINNGKANDFGRGGGIYIDSHSDVTLDSVLVFNNKALWGGGIYTPSRLVQAKPVLKRVKIISNDASKGGGVFVGGTDTGMVTFYSCDVWNNTAEVYGGGFYITRTSNKTEFYDVSIKLNSSETKGGGIYVYDAKPRIERSLFEGNASKNGGAIYVDRPNAELNLVNSILYNNTATEYGSAISFYNRSTANIYHTTISNNTAGLDATIRPDYGSKIYFYNSVLWNNAATNQIAFGGTQNTAGRFEAKNSIIQGLNSIQISDNNDVVDTDNSNFETDPIFSNAVLNDYTLQNYSPAIGYGTNDASFSPASIPVSLDFNSNSRPTGNNPDIGAHENSLDSPANAKPLLNQNIWDLSVDEDSGERTVSFTGVDDGDFHANQTLTVTATSDNTGLIPHPTVTYTSPDTAGTITFTPVPDTHGTINLTVKVTDNGGSANGGIDTVSTSFKVTVNPIVPDDFKPTQTNIGGVIQGTPRLNGSAASNLDWIVSFDSKGKVVGSAPLVNLVDDVRFGVGNSNFILYGDDPTTSDIDEGMNPGEDFTLKIWDQSTNQIFVQADGDGKQLTHSGWAGTNFIPITGYDNPDALFNFVYNTDPVIQQCNVTTLNEDQQYEFTLSDFQYSDEDSISNTNLAVIIDPGNNYSVTGNSITPASNYSGPIQVAFRLDDGFSSSTVFNADINVLSVDDPPEVKNKINNITVDEDAANTTIDLSATFTDVDNDDSDITKAITGNTPSGKIVASISNDILTLDYQDNQSGIVAITLTGTSNGLTVDTSFTVTINAVNDVAAATDQTVSADEDKDKTITLAGTDADGDALTYNITTLPAYGTLFQTSDGSTRGNSITTEPTTVSDTSHRVIYVSAPDGSGDGHGNFGFKVNDGTSDSDEATVTVNVAPVDDRLQATAQTVTGTEDTDVTIILAGTDSDGRSFSFKITALPTNGFLFQTSDGTTRGDTITLVPTTVSDGSHRVIYLSAQDGNGDGHGNFGFKIYAGTSGSAETAVTVNISNVNDVAVAVNQTVTADEDIDKAITLAGTDIDGDTLTYNITTLPINGTLFQTSDGSTRGNTITTEPTTVSDASHRVIYVSTQDSNGDGHGNFGFKVNDGTTDSEEATVIVNVSKVNDVATATAQTVTADEDIDKTITLAGTDIDGDPLTYKISTLPANGYLFQTSDGTTRGDTITSDSTIVSDASHRIIYLSAKDGNGDGHGNFGFKVNDGTIDSDETTVTVNVTSQPEDIEATAQTVTADEDIDKSITLAGTDIDGDALTYNITTLPANGTLFQTSDGTTKSDTISSVPTTVSDASHRIIYLSAKDGNGDGHGNFGFKVNDGTIDSDETIVTVNVTKVNDLATAISQSVNADEDINKSITLTGTDVDGDTLLYKITTLPANGNLFQTSDGTTRGDTITSASTTVSDASHRIIYLSAKDGNGVNYGNFGFKVNDGAAESEEAIVTINVININDLPSATDQAVSADEDIDKTIILAATDVDGDTLSYKISTLPANGYLFQTSDGSTRGDTIISTPTTVSDTLQRVIYISAQDGYGDGHGNFGFKANDGTADSEEITVMVNVAPKVEDREAIPQTVSATEDTDVTITLIGADKDGDPLTYKITTLPVNGNLFETTDGLTRGNTITSVPTTISGPVHRIIYISAKDGNGDGHGNFGFKVNDGTADGNEAIVTINVNAANDPPTPITIISPADSSEIMITINNKDTSRVVFDWTSSIDVENNELTYMFEYELKMVNINDETISYYDGKDLLYPGFTITYSEILENLDHFLSAGGIITWSVDVTDGIDTVYAEEERVIFVIGKYAALAVDETTIPDEYSLNQNYPNPFNPTTRIQYSLPKAGLVQISIYTLMGQKIATLVNRNMDAGQYIITWHAMNDQGRKVPSGIYFYTLESGSYRSIKKLVLLK